MKPAQKTILERREGKDRRRWTCNLHFPYVDGHGFLVEDDRRKSTDRRKLHSKARSKS